MSRSFLTSDALAAYVEAHSDPLDAVAADLVARTAELGDVAGMQIGADQAALMTALARLTGTRRAVEVGTFTGMSALAIARGLAAGGRLVCCDVSEEWTAIARQAWDDAGVADRIDLRIAPAAETLAGDLFDGEPIDLAFVDADKPGYVTYHELLVPRLRPGGLLAVDNTLWGGDVVEPDEADANRTAIRTYNDHAVADDRVGTVMVTVGDGVTLNVRR
ncbi:SAM-dependent methyltransferase [Iamia sp. SCSIO 61187]|uniref:O-methyltransferase n=1 Tax=Iamia sp. SCSIO 61187 TaxID=2722752 RepID=UPI001C62DA0C|nr:O-methyltransferase [Iamia sp. SCSIO 61187]QYG93477.1 SAM-dependent methyltransferase [Iamia sp. SCSIO 61187]